MDGCCVVRVAVSVAVAVAMFVFTLVVIVLLNIRLLAEHKVISNHYFHCTLLINNK